MADADNWPRCPRGEHRGSWELGSPPLDTFTDGSGWSCPGILADGTVCGYELRRWPSAPLRGRELREHLGRAVREAWVACALEQDDPKPSHLIGWDELDEWNKEVDRRIGDAVAAEVARLSGAVPVIDMGFLSLPAEIQADIESDVAARRKDNPDA